MIAAELPSGLEKTMHASEIDRRCAEIEDRGFTILERVIEPELTAELVSATRQVERERGTVPKNNPAEGFATLRNYNLLAKHPAFAKMPIHSEVLPIVERMLDPGCLLSGMTMMDIGPGEKAQPLHPDDLVMSVPRPHLPLMITTIWALTDFTDANGATRLVPGTHKSAETPDYRKSYDSIPCEMPAGSVVILHASLWHGGGANRTESDWRLGANVQYCAGYIRTQQNHYLGIPRETLLGFPERLRELLGLSLYKGIMGHVDGKSPGAVLGDTALADTAYASPRMSALASEKGAEALAEAWPEAAAKAQGDAARRGDRAR
jgi:ectoine hydroxylase-related dioxygenase (phytanoyl-CoA dioxygenase family)